MRKLTAIWLLGVIASLCAVDSLANKKPDVRLVIDVSGSMKRNDPKNLREPSVGLLVQLLPEESRGGVWTFGKFVNMLVKHQETDAAWKKQAKSKAGDINSVGLYTNIGEALEKAAYDLKSKSREDYNTSIILLTDGMVDVDKDPKKNDVERKRIIKEILPTLVDAGVTVHTIALSDNADKLLLDRLSLDTDGISATAYSADDLMKIFLQAFDASAPAQQVPFDGQSFVVDSSVEEFTALIFHEGSKIKLVEPNKTKHGPKTKDNNVKWYQTDTYDLITVKRPLEGEWNIEGESGSGSRVTVVSNLNLRVKPVRQNLSVGESIKLRYVLEEDGQVIRRKDFLSVMDYEVTVKKKGQKKTIFKEKVRNNPPPANGVYEKTIPEINEKGEYVLKLFADGKSFSRQFNHRFDVRTPYAARLDQKLDDEGEAYYLLSVYRQLKTDNDLKVSVTATLTNPERRKKTLAFVLVDGDRWQSKLEPSLTGVHKISTIVVENASDGPNKIPLKSLVFDHQPGEDFETLVTSKSELSDPAYDTGQAKEDDKDWEGESDAPPKGDLQTGNEFDAPDEDAFKAEVKEKGLDKELEELDTETKDEEEPEPEPEQEPESEGDSSNIILFSVLGLVNLLGIGAGYIIYKKMFGNKSEEEAKPDKKEEAKENEPKKAPVVEQSAGEPPDMMLDDADDEEPPMEDLEPDEDIIADIGDETILQEPPSVDDIDLDFGLDDDEPEAEPEEEIQEEPIEEETPIEEDPTDDMMEEMLKAQGLDLAEEELDDAISNLIDELDSETLEDEPERKKDDDPGIGNIGIDDLDDFGLDD